MGAHRKTISEMPAWLNELPGNARLSRAELAKVLGYAKAQSFTTALFRGMWPQLLEIEIRHTGFGRRPNGAPHVHCHYRVSDVRRVVRELIASQK